MAYVKISDPNIIDLSAWHQVINVVNQHSDSIAALTNNFGLAYAPVFGTGDTNTDDWSTPYDSGSQQIVYGRTVLSTALADPAGTTKDRIQTLVTYASPFTQAPVVTATAISGSTGLHQAVATITASTPTSFTIVVGNLSTLTTSPEKVTVNWIAIGPK